MSCLIWQKRRIDMAKDMDRWNLYPGQLIELNYVRYYVLEGDFGDVQLENNERKAKKKW